MRKFLLTSFAFLLSAPAFAADPVAPVKQIMDITVKNWSGEAEEWKYIFDEDLLKSVFSSQFADAYREAAKKPAYDAENDEPGDPFGYDVVTNSQDGCPIEDLSIKSEPLKDGVTDVAVTFKLWNCMDDAEMKAMVNEIHFDVKDEDGKPVISDIHRVGEDGRDSVLEEMAGIAKGE
jgi:hypothetical protein